MADEAITGWLLDSDPALRWRVERDLLGEPALVWQATRDRVAREGFGARLLALQDPDGQWAGGAYFPADTQPDEEGQPWTATTWSLNALREWGVPAEALQGTADKLAAGCRWEYEDLPYWTGEVDVCINAYTLANGAWLGADIDDLAAWFASHQLEDGGWNCEWVEGSVRSSFHSTLNAVRGLREYEAITGDATLAEVRRRGEEYLLERNLLLKKSSGEPVGPWANRMSFPFRWAYSAIKALDHLVEASALDATAPDPRAAQAIGTIKSARQPDGTWIREHRPAGREWFDVDNPVGQPSRWLTYYALRILRWADGEAADRG